MQIVELRSNAENAVFLGMVFPLVCLQEMVVGNAAPKIVAIKKGVSKRISKMN